MADDLMMSDTATIDLDLNLEPSDSSPGSSIQLWSLIDELENAHGQIEERIRQLEAITARARQRQRRISTEEGETAAAPFHVTDPSINNSQQEAAMADRAKSGKRGRSCLVAEALGLNTIAKNNVVGDGGGFFDCNVCFDIAKEPILTCCGHLFCWACFHQLPYVYSTARECPSCKGEIGENKIVPIYGNGGNFDSTNSGFGSRIPPRPKANRVESLRDHRVSHIPVSAALRRIRMGIDSNGSPGTQIRNIPNLTSLTESAASVSSISSAINSAERLVEDLETYLRNRILRRTDSDMAFLVSNAEAQDPIVSAGRSDEEQLARMITSAGPVTFSRSGGGPRSPPEVADEESESSHEVQRRRLI